MARWKIRILGWVLLLLGGLYRSPGAAVEPKKDYVGSETCARGHAPHYARWQTSLHSKMYQKADQTPDAILGDFTRPDPLRTFKKEDVAYTIGSRWEQMYVTKRAGEEYLLPAKWLIAPKQWAPLDATHRRNEPMAKTCHGCHTTAWNPQAKTYVEMNIGCEACHGPGREHARTQSKSAILRTTNPEVCGRCHSRGQDRQAGLDYIVQFDPRADKLAERMAFTQPEGQTTRSWWANAIERDRHQEYLGYLQSGHARSLETVRQWAEHHPDQVNAGCYTCHSSEYRSAPTQAKPPLAQLHYGVTCSECHDPHGEGPRGAPARPGPGDAGCLTCHFVPGTAGHATRRHHYPCPKEAVRCIDCHMPVTGMTAAEFNIRSHTLKIISPHEAEKLGMPSSCNNSRCHADKNVTWMKEQFNNRWVKSSR